MGAYQNIIVIGVTFFGLAQAQLNDTALPPTTKRLRDYHGNLNKSQRLELYLSHHYVWDEVEAQPTSILYYDQGGSIDKSISRYEDLILKLPTSLSKDSPWLRFNPYFRTSSESLKASQLLPKSAQVLNNTYPEKDHLRIVKTAFKNPLLPKDDMFQTAPTPYYPNCFGTAFSLHEPSQKFLFLSGAEFQEKLNTDFSVIKPGEKINFGDIMTIYKKQSDTDTLTLIHASIVITRHYVWGRSSSNNKDPWTFQSMNTDFFTQFESYKTLADDDEDIYYGDLPYFGSFRVIFWKKK